MSKIDKTLDDIKHLYDLVADMRETVERLKGVGVEVRITRFNDYSDPLSAFAQLHITLRPGCEVYPS